MKLFNFSNENKSRKGKMIFAPLNFGINKIKETLKGVVESKKIQFPSQLGEEHPFDYNIVSKLCLKFGIIDAIVDKHVDYIFSGGIVTASEDERAKTIIDNFRQDFAFDNLARVWVRQGLKKGFSPIEISEDDTGNIDGLKVLKSDFLYVDRNEFGKLEGFNQYLKPLKGFSFSKNNKDIEPFEVKQIADLNININDDEYYGVGIVYPALKLINDWIGARKEMHTLMQRKANNPLFFIMGDKAKGEYPEPEEMDELGSRMEYLNNKHEWVLSDYIKPMTLDFGNIGDKFQFIVDNDESLTYSAFQTPEVIMGKGNIAEGLAKVQMRAWLLRINSLREEIEKVIEEKIFKRVLNANGIDSHVEIIWGLPSQDEINDKLDKITNLLKVPLLGENLRVQLEMQIGELLNIVPEDLETPPEERKKEEEEEKLPVVPSERQRTSSKNPPKTIESLEQYDNLSVQEFIGFNYSDYVSDIMDETKEDPFATLSAGTATEIRAGLLSPTEIEKLRFTMQEAFERNLTIKEVEKLLKKRIEFKDRFRMKDGKIVLNRSGKPSLALSAKRRPIAVARSETVRLSNLGAKRNYRKNGIVFNIDSSPEPPLHTMCRCTLAGVVE